MCTVELSEIDIEDEGEDQDQDDFRLYVEDWPLWATDGSLIVIDEVQRIWRPGNSSQIPTDDISRLETHRHRGLDFWLISQGPHLFHSNIRLLIGRHIHLVAKWNGRTEYEWPECRQNVTSRGDAVTRPYALPSKIFHLYKSASLHVKQTHRKPLAFYGLFGCVIFLLIAIFFSYQRVTSHINPKAQETNALGAGATTTVTTQGGAGVGVGGLGSQPQQAVFPDFKPKIDGVPESAPAYSELVKVTAAPIMVGCVYSIAKDKCSCYTNQATPYPTSNEYCMETVKNHRFNPYASPVQVVRSSSVIEARHSENKQFPIVQASNAGLKSGTDNSVVQNDVRY